MVQLKCKEARRCQASTHSYLISAPLRPSYQRTTLIGTDTSQGRVTHQIGDHLLQELGENPHSLWKLRLMYCQGIEKE